MVGVIVSELEVILTGDKTGLTRTLNSARTDVKNAASTMGSDAGTGAKKIGDAFAASFAKVGTQARQLGQTMSVALSLPILAGFKKGVDAASDLNETIAKTREVFGGATDSVLNFSRSSASSLGLAQTAALDFASSFGLILQAGGKTERQSADMSMVLSKLSGDLASFFNTDVETAAQKIKSGLVGEAEPLRAFGVLLSETAVKSKALSMGFKEVGGQLPETAKVQARYALILEQTAKAQGDFNRTSSGFANQTRILKADVANLAADLGKTLLPIAQELVKRVREGIEVFKGFSDEQKRASLAALALAAAAGPLLIAFGALSSAVSGMIGLFTTIAPAFAAAGSGAGVLGATLTALSGPIGWVIAGVAALVVAWKTNFGGLRDFTDGIVTQIVTFWRNNFPLIKEAAINVFNGIKVAFAPFLSALYQGWQNLVAVTGWAWTSIKSIVQGVTTVVLGTVKAFAQILTGNWRGAFTTIQSATQSAMFGIGAVIARSVQTFLKTLDGFFDAISKGYHDLKAMFGLADGAAGNFTGFDGMINGLGDVAKGAEAAGKALRGNITGKGTRPGLAFGPMGAGNGVGTGANKKPWNVDEPVAPFSPGGAPSKSTAAPAMKAANQQAEELRRTIAELKKTMALNGETTKSASILYDLQNGVIEKGNKALAVKAYWFAILGEAQERQRKANEALAAITSGLVDSTTALVRSTRASTAVTVEDSIAIEKYGKTFAELTDEKNRAAVVDAANAKRDADRVSGMKAATDWVKQTVDSLREELALRLAKTRVDRLEIELSKEKYASLTAEQRAAALAAAAALDKDDDQKARVAMLEKARGAWEKITAEVRKYRVEMQAAADKRFGEQMARLTERVARLGTQSVASREQMRLLAEEFGVGKTAADRIADGMGRAREYMDKLFRVEQLEQFVAAIDKVADGFTTTLTDSLGALFSGGVKPFFANLLEGFRSTLAEMAQDWLKSEIRRVLSNGLRGLVGGLVGGISGGGLSDAASGGNSVVTARATGGSVSPGELFRMNEHGRDEIFASRNGGVVIPASLSRQIAGGLGGGINVYMTVNTPNADSFRDSEEQIITRLAQKVAAVQMRKNS